VFVNDGRLVIWVGFGYAYAFYLIPFVLNASEAIEAQRVDLMLHVRIYLESKSQIKAAEPLV